MLNPHGTATPRSSLASMQRWRWQIFAITWLAYAAFYFTRKAFSVAKLGIAEDPTFPLDKVAMANLDAIYLAAYAVGQFTWGIFADRFGPRVVVFGGLAISALAALVMGSFATLPIFATCMVVQGLAQSTGWSGLCKNIGSFFATHERGRVLGLWSTCYAFGGLVASPFAGWWAYEVFGTWHAAFYSSAAVVGGVAILFLLLQRNRPQDVGLQPVEPEIQQPEAVRYAGFKPEGQNGKTLRILGKVLRNRTVLTLGLAYFLLKPARYAILLWGPVIVYERMPALGKVGAAILPSAFEVAGLLGPILIGYASDRLFGARRMPACVISLIGLTACLALFVPAMHTGSSMLVLGLLFMMGLTLYGPDSMISGAAAVDFGTGEAAGTAAGFVNGCSSIGAILGGLLPGYFDTYTVFIGFTVAALVASAVLLPHWNSRPEHIRHNEVQPDPQLSARPARS
ncbi:MFS transporter [Pseudomonas sp. ZM23]|uniref:MFS transporter n=1 Tax=Pseudomonas triclosanedens TaxID=2961893 RepID=A0ABY7A4J1_9PSED|nr:MFS transporter [Pseudomonas triclosanedens]MCP8465558.1 MFS transporter [Pseudomonas triclosanedens]MCP8471053.1 MFS transporter [Pseudomonas triclosanedens]MCP8476857.1 MFS transporter [Pseudomonas triclosanedens]WAI52028.1 MFS transporter [Pseudomonas triclosanedens]